MYQRRFIKIQIKINTALLKASIVSVKIYRDPKRKTTYKGLANVGKFRRSPQNQIDYGFIREEKA